MHENSIFENPQDALLNVDVYEALSNVRLNLGFRKVRC